MLILRRVQERRIKIPKPTYGSKVCMCICMRPDEENTDDFFTNCTQTSRKQPGVAKTFDQTFASHQLDKQYFSTMHSTEGTSSIVKMEIAEISAQKPTEYQNRALNCERAKCNANRPKEVWIMHTEKRHGILLLRCNPDEEMMTSDMRSQQQYLLSPTHTHTSAVIDLLISFCVLKCVSWQMHNGEGARRRGPRGRRGGGGWEEGRSFVARS